MEQKVQQRTWRCGLDLFGDEIVWEFWWIGGELGAQQYIVRQVVDDGLPLTCQSMLSQRRCLGRECFGMDEVALCGWQVYHETVSSLVTELHI